MIDAYRNHLYKGKEYTNYEESKYFVCNNFSIIANESTGLDIYQNEQLYGHFMITEYSKTPILYSEQTFFVCSL